MKILAATLLALTIIACNNNEVQNHGKVSNDAVSILKADIAAFPDSLLLRELLVQQYRDSGYYDSALLVTNEVLKKDSTIARFWYIKGTLQLESEDTSSGIYSYEQAAKFYPSEKYLTELGNIYAIVGNKKAIAVANLLAKSPNIKTQRNPNFMQGLYYNTIGGYNNAIPFFDKCLEISYTDMEAYTAKSIALYNMAKYNEALAVLDKALTLQNNFDVGYFYRGKNLEKLNRIDEAKQAYKQALLYDKDYYEAREAFERLGGK